MQRTVVGAWCCSISTACSCAAMPSRASCVRAWPVRGGVCHWRWSPAAVAVAAASPPLAAHAGGRHLRAHHPARRGCRPLPRAGALDMPASWCSSHASSFATASRTMRRHIVDGDRVIIVTGCEQNWRGRSSMRSGCTISRSSPRDCVKAGSACARMCTTSVRASPCRSPAQGHRRTLGHRLQRLVARHPDVQAGTRRSAGERRARRPCNGCERALAASACAGSTGSEAA